MSSGPRAVPTYSSTASAPSNYVAGLGRGAIGFTTRSDIGPARDAAPSAVDMPQFGMQPTQMLQRALDSGPGDGGSGAATARRQDSANFNDSQYDEEYGYSGTLFKDTPYEEDDAEADRIYEAIDERMDERRKRRREEQILENMKKYRQERPKIQDQFADLKRELASVPETAWESIPDVGDYSLKLKQKKKAETFTPLPDSVLGSRGGAGNVASISSAPGSATPLGMATPGLGGLGGQTPLGIATPYSGLGGTQSESGGLAQARGISLSLKLDKMSDSVSGQTVVDPKGYLTDLNSIKIMSEGDVGDLKKARLLLKSVTTTNPKHGPGWIAAARIEEKAGKIVMARQIINQGCEICPDSEDVWLEAARLQSVNNAKVILANAVRHLSHSVKIWSAAAELESESERKKIVLRRALEFVPNSVKLWRAVIELEDADDARIMLGRAVECVPHSVDMWLALARLETYDNARKVLNQARQAIPTEPAIWITAAKLEEAHGNTDKVGKIVEKAVQVLTRDQVVIDREHWLKEAEAAEHSGAPVTCAALVRNSIWRGVEDDDRKRTWMDDAESCLAHNAIATARAVYSHALTVFPAKKSVWKAACDLEKKHGTAESLDQMLVQAVANCPHAEVLWLIRAKEKWLGGDVPAARLVLVDAFKANPESEDILLAAAKLEWENDEYERARILLQTGCQRSPSAKIYMKLALLERQCDIDGTNESGFAELQVLNEAIQHFPDFDKFYMMAGQACERAKTAATTSADQMEATGKARAYYQSGLRECQTCIPLWQLAAALEEKHSAVKARSMLELARMKNPKNELLWLQAIRLERQNAAAMEEKGNSKMATTLMAKALQECPDSGVLWAEEIKTAARPDRRSKSLEALKRCDNNPHVIGAAASLFVDERKYPKARKWYDRAVKIDDSIGDVWAQYYAFEVKHGEEDTRQDVLKRCVAADPKSGEVWCKVSKEPMNRKLSTSDVLVRVAKIYST